MWGHLIYPTITLFAAFPGRVISISTFSRVSLDLALGNGFKTIEGLWRRPTKGVRGAVAKLGDMTSYIRENCLLEPRCVNELVASTPIGQDVPIEVLDQYLELVTEGRKL